MSIASIVILSSICLFQGWRVFIQAQAIRDLRHSLRARDARIESLEDELWLLPKSPNDSQSEEIQRLRELCRSVRSSYRRRLGRGKVQCEISMPLNWP